MLGATLKDRMTNFVGGIASLNLILTGDIARGTDERSTKKIMNCRTSTTRPTYRDRSPER